MNKNAVLEPPPVATQIPALLKPFTSLAIAEATNATSASAQLWRNGATVPGAHRIEGIANLTHRPLIDVIRAITADMEAVMAHRAREREIRTGTAKPNHKPRHRTNSDAVMAQIST